MDNGLVMDIVKNIVIVDMFGLGGINLLSCYFFRASIELATANTHTTL